MGSIGCIGWQSSTRHSTDSDPFRGNRNKASYQFFILLFDQFNQILSYPVAL